MNSNAIRDIQTAAENGKSYHRKEDQKKTLFHKIILFHFCEK